MLLDRAATLARAAQLLAQAAGEGATLIVFPGSFVPGYPSWIWRLAAGRDGALMGALHARLPEQSMRTARCLRAAGATCADTAGAVEGRGTRCRAGGLRPAAARCAPLARRVPRRLRPSKRLDSRRRPTKL